MSEGQFKFPYLLFRLKTTYQYHYAVFEAHVLTVGTFLPPSIRFH